MDVHTLFQMTQAQLDELFKQSAAGNPPDGEGAGTAVIFPGTWWAKFFAWLARCFFWQGKTFNARAGSLRNRITPFGLSAIKAKVYKEASWLDQKECIILDYSKTSLVAQWIRDEIRLIEPGTYLGKVYGGKKRLIDFALQFK